jgi:predicted nuclease of restriction endonuclease-like (RecB) superfamily
MLTHHVEAALYHRQGKALDYFTHALLSPDSDLTRESIKDPHNFDFLMFSERAQERTLQLGLIESISSG